MADIFDKRRRKERGDSGVVGGGTGDTCTGSGDRNGGRLILPRFFVRPPAPIADSGGGDDEAGEGAGRELTVSSVPLSLPHYIRTGS